MRIKTDSKSLSEALKLARQVVPSKPTLPMLGSVLLDAQGDVLTITATNLTTTYRTTVECESSEDGKACLPLAGLLSVANRPRARAIEIKAPLTGSAEIKAGRAKSKIPVSHPDEFPAVPVRSGEPQCSLPGVAVAGLLDTVAHAISRDESRLSFMGVCSHLLPDGKARVIATDGYRLAMAATGEDITSDSPAVIPVEAVSLLRKMKSVGAVHFARDGAVIHIWTDGIAITSQLIPARWPDVSRVIPDFSSCHKIIVTVEDAQDALRRASDFSPKTGHTKIDVDGDTITVSAFDDGKGSHSEPVDCEGFGGALSFGSNGAFLADALKAITGERAEVYIDRKSPENNPIVIIDPSNPHNVQLVMPMQF